jgi:3-phosphoshikimate 1-carboxyvinyltransferase
MMIAPKLEKGLTITLTNTVISKPYIRMTQQIMADFGVKTTFSNQTIEISPQTYKSVPFHVESDWSAASYWYELLTIHGRGKLQLPGLKQESTQGDSKLIELFQHFGVTTKFIDELAEIEIKLKKSKHFEYDFSDEPDIVQTLAVTCCMTQTPFRFTGLASLKIKETDRVAALITELGKCGFELTEPAENELAWNGIVKPTEQNISISTYDDHRMAMAFAPISLKLPIKIEHPEVVSKSYPNFWEELLRFDN